MTTPTDVLTFWFEELEFKQWWNTYPEVDAAILKRFGATHEAATKGELFTWRETPEGRLAEVIVLDQFSRNLFRNDPRSFAYDPMALVLAQEAIAVGDDKRLDQMRVSFLYMPFMHSESLAIHEIALKLFSGEGLEKNLESLHKHTDVLRKFGRYPHRNEVLGRESTADEVAFLEGGRGF